LTVDSTIILTMLPPNASPTKRFDIAGTKTSACAAASVAVKTGPLVRGNRKLTVTPPGAYAFGGLLILTSWLLLIAAILIFLVGTEIRVRIEDGLLALQFGEDFTAYKRKVPAYIPWLR